MPDKLISWKIVYNTPCPLQNLHPDAYDFITSLPHIVKTGYQFFRWNGYVYFIHSNGSASRTDIKVENIF